MFEVVAASQAVIEAQKDIETYLHRFLASLDIRMSSKQTYRRQLIAFFEWIKKQQPSEIKRETILEYKAYLHETKELSALTVGGYLTALRRFFEWLEAIKIYPNVAKSVRGPKRKRGFKKDSLSIGQVKQLLDTIDTHSLQGKRDYAMMNLMIRTGIRTIEVVRATREDMAQFSGVQVLWIHGKGRDTKDEFVVLTDKVLKPIYDYIHARGPIKETTALFGSCSTKNFGKKLTTRSVSRIVKNQLKKIGLDDSRVTAHSLRHTAITLSLIAGATPQEARALARHSDINTTMIYAHNINRIANAPEFKIDSLF